VSIIQAVQAAVAGGGGPPPPPPTLNNYFFQGASTAWGTQSQSPTPANQDTRYPNGATNQALYFNGLTWTLSQSLGLCNEIEVDMWIYPAANNCIIMTEQDNTVENTGYTYVMLEIDSSNQIRARSWPQNGGSALISAPITLNAWHHVYFRHSGGIARLEVDGALSGTDIYDRGAPGTTYLGIGTFSQTGITSSSRFQGKVDSVQFRSYNFVGSSWAGSNFQYRPSLMVELDANNGSAYNQNNPTVWNDTSGNGYNATLYNSPTYYSAGPNYFTFDRNSLQYGLVPNIGNLPRFTVEGLFRISEPYTNIRSTAVVATVFDLADDANIDYGYVNYCIGTNGNAEFNAYWYGQFFDGALWRQPNAGFVGYSNTWFHAVVTYDGETLRFYKNGTQIGSSVLYSTPQANGGPVRIARRWDGYDNQSDNYFPGDIGIVRIWANAMSPGDVQQRYAAAVNLGYPGI
jgi:hypothetical protein